MTARNVHAFHALELLACHGRKCNAGGMTSSTVINELQVECIVFGFVVLLGPKNLCDKVPVLVLLHGNIVSTIASTTEPL